MHPAVSARKQRPPRQASLRASARNFLPQLDAYQDKERAGQIRPFRRVTVMGAGNRANTALVAGSGETAASGANVQILQFYTAAFGVAGGPATGDDAYCLTLEPGVEVLVGHLVRP